MGQRWSASEMKLVRGNLSTGEIARRTGRTPAAVSSKRTALRNEYTLPGMQPKASSNGARTYRLDDGDADGVVVALQRVKEDALTNLEDELIELEQETQEIDQKRVEIEQEMKDLQAEIAELEELRDRPLTVTVA